jgi:hypothetical protein
MVCLPRLFMRRICQLYSWRTNEARNSGAGTMMSCETTDVETTAHGGCSLISTSRSDGLSTSQNHDETWHAKCFEYEGMITMADQNTISPRPFTQTTRNGVHLKQPSYDFRQQRYFQPLFPQLIDSSHSLDPLPSPSSTSFSPPFIPSFPSLPINQTRRLVYANQSLSVPTQKVFSLCMGRR